MSGSDRRYECAVAVAIHRVAVEIEVVEQAHIIARHYHFGVREALIGSCAKSAGGRGKSRIAWRRCERRVLQHRTVDVDSSVDDADFDPAPGVWFATDRYARPRRRNVDEGQCSIEQFVILDRREDFRNAGESL